jgi:hypothetical protein
MKRLLFVVSVCVLAVGAAACGGDDDSEALVTPGDQPDAGAESNGDTDEASAEVPGDGDGDVPPRGSDGPAGSGTVTIGDEIITFDVVFCGFSPDEVGNPNVTFSLFGADEAADLRVDVNQSVDPRSGATEEEPLENIFITYGSQANPDRTYTAMSIPPIGSPFLEIDGNSVSATAEFLDDDGVGTQGTLEATCP